MSFIFGISNWFVWSWNYDCTNMFELLLRREFEVKSIVESPSFNIWSLTWFSSHVLTHEKSLHEGLEMGSTISVQKCNFRVEVQLVKSCVSSWLHCVEQFFCTVCYYFIVEWWNIVLFESWVNHLGKRNPMERKVLELCAIHELQQNLIYGFYTEKWHWEKDCQMRSTDNFHIHAELVGYENLENFFHLFIFKNSHFYVFSAKLVDNSFYL